jgi:hypothetical protein
MTQILIPAGTAASGRGGSHEASAVVRRQQVTRCDLAWTGIGTWAKSRRDATLSGRLGAGQGRTAKAFPLAGAARAWEQGERMGLKRAVEFAVALHPE